MAKCIRCGLKQAADGENMCPECQAWYNSQAAGASSAKRMNPYPANHSSNRTGNPVNVPGRGESRNPVNGPGRGGRGVPGNVGGYPGVPGGQPIPNGRQPENKPKKSKVLLIIGIAAGILIWVLVIFIVFNFVLKKEKDGGDNSSAGDSGIIQMEETESQSEGIGSETDSSSELTEAVLTERVRALQQLYSDQQAEYSTRDWQTMTVDNTVLYYFDGKLREAEVKNGTESFSYNYDNGEVYYAIINISGYEELYWDNNELICWIEADGTIHNQENSSGAYLAMDSYWDKASEIYQYYGSYDQVVPSEEETTTQEPTQAPTQETIQAASEFIFPNSASSYLSRSDLVNKSQWELKVARNEIFARYGYKFDAGSELAVYFEGCSWYSGTIDSDIFEDVVSLNDYETYNWKLIYNYEKEMGYKVPYSN